MASAITIAGLTSPRHTNFVILKYYFMNRELLFLETMDELQSRVDSASDYDLLRAGFWCFNFSWTMIKIWLV